MRRLVVGLLILISALTLIVSSTSLWTRRHVVNTEVFVTGAQAILTDPAVQARIQSEVVGTIMTNPDVEQAINQTIAVLPPRLQTFRPMIEDGAQTLLGRGVHAILISPAFDRLTGAALRSAQTQLINGQSVVFTLGQAKALVPAQDRTGLAGQVLNLIPDNVGITVVTKEQAPQLYTAVDLLKSLWLWLGLVSLAALVGALVVSRRRLKTLRAWSVTTGLIGLLLVAALAVARGPLLGQVKPANVDAADAIYQGVTASLRSWTLWLVLIMAVVMVVTLLWGRIGIIPAIERGYRAVRSQAARQREEHAAARTLRAAAAEAGADGTEQVPAAVPEKSWPRRVAASTREFVDELNLPERFAALAEFLGRHLQAARWTGVAVGAVILLLWPSPTLPVLIWTAALVALYISLLELVLAIAATAPSSADEATLDRGLGAEASVPAGHRAVAPAPVTAVTGPTRDASDVVPAARTPVTPLTPAGYSGEQSGPGVARSGGDAALDPIRPVAPVQTQSTADAPPHRRPVTAEDMSAMANRLDMLMRLGDARTAGVLTEEEFTREKAQLLMQ
jgi:hypothetical protein